MLSEHRVRLLDELRKADLAASNLQRFPVSNTRHSQAGQRAAGSNATDGGTRSRLFGSFISWMQEKQSPVFVVATANDVFQLPPETLRKGRFDELFFVDLPNVEEKNAIWSIQIRHYDPKDYDLVQLSRVTEGLSGLEALV